MINRRNRYLQDIWINDETIKFIQEDKETVKCPVRLRKIHFIDLCVHQIRFVYRVRCILSSMLKLYSHPLVFRLENSLAKPIKNFTTGIRESILISNF